MMTSAGPQIPTAQFDQTAQLQMMASPGQPPLPGQQAVMQQQLQQMQQQMQQMQQLMHPAMNDAPLEFNMNKNKPPMPISSKLLIIFNILCFAFNFFFYNDF